MTSGLTRVAGDNRRGPLLFYDSGFPKFQFTAEFGLPADVSAVALGVIAHIMTSVYAIIFALAIWGYAVLGIHTRKAFLTTFGAWRVDRRREPIGYWLTIIVQILLGVGAMIFGVFKL